MLIQRWWYLPLGEITILIQTPCYILIKESDVVLYLSIITVIALIWDHQRIGLFMRDCLISVKRDALNEKSVWLTRTRSLTPALILALKHNVVPYWLDLHLMYVPSLSLPLLVLCTASWEQNGMAKENGPSMKGL